MSCLQIAAANAVNAEEANTPLVVWPAPAASDTGLMVADTPEGATLTGNGTGHCRHSTNK